MIPIGDLLAHCATWGINNSEASTLLQGSSPATTETAQLLAPAVRAIDDAGRIPASVEEVRNLGPDAREAVDAWLERHAWRTITTDDIDRSTIAERPALQLSALLARASAASVATHRLSPTSQCINVAIAARAVLVASRRS